MTKIATDSQLATSGTSSTTNPIASGLRSACGRFAYATGLQSFGNAITEIRNGEFPNAGRSLLVSGLHAASSVALVALSYYLYEASLDHTVPLGKAIRDGDDTAACAIIREHPSALNGRSLQQLGGENNTDSDIAVVRCIAVDPRLSIHDARFGLDNLAQRGNAVAHGELLSRTSLSTSYYPGLYIDDSAEMLKASASVDAYKQWLSVASQRQCATPHLYGQLADNGLDAGVQAVEPCSSYDSKVLNSSVLARFKQSLSPERYIALLKAEAEEGHADGLRALVEEGEYGYVAEKLSAAEGDKPDVHLHSRLSDEILGQLVKKNEYSDELVTALAARRYGSPGYSATHSALTSYLEKGNTDAFVKLSSELGVDQSQLQRYLPKLAEQESDILDTVLRTFKRAVQLSTATGHSSRVPTSNRGSAVSVRALTDDAGAKLYCAVQEHNSALDVVDPEDHVAELVLNASRKKVVAERMLACLTKAFPRTKADVMQNHQTGDTLYHEVAKRGDVRAWRLLSAADIGDVGAANAAGELPFTQLVETHGLTKRAEVMAVANELTPEQLNAVRSYDGASAVHLAAKNSMAKLYCDLINAGADSNVTDERGLRGIDDPGVVPASRAFMEACTPAADAEVS